MHLRFEHPLIALRCVLKYSRFQLAGMEHSAFVRIQDAFSSLPTLMQWDIWLIYKSGLVFIFSFNLHIQFSTITQTFHLIIFLSFRCRMYGWCCIQFNWEEAYGGWKTINLHDGLFTTEVSNTSWIFYIISFYAVFMQKLLSYQTLICLFGQHNFYKLV